MVVFARERDTFGEGDSSAEAKRELIVVLHDLVNSVFVNDGWHDLQ